MYSESIILKEILEAREKRARTQTKLISMFKTTLVSFTLNIPGQEKNNSIFKKAHELGINLLEKELGIQNVKVVNKLVNFTVAGTEAFLNIDMDPIQLKKITVSIEEKNDLGRIFDFDVINTNGEQISRRQLNLALRKCLLCNENAKVCGRSRKHSIDDLLIKIYQVINAHK
ncbi:citrate lyase holo-[acyl-carrier protein] synthase [Clostridium estertheticum]|uniref:citrate lyase holo-[acyl-carrier protein] synthase n=1 Tax=Clostridium estertheticum TaxID=238834 RepID=UPI001C0C399E|nr:citrate lyase holo-[acyl-carrier protein] synthase [Clostridium estertheticum]MBU3071858.1 citrate lyase holo-[acyl-carrier protein] synthase [Clostridium estertheticum]MBU3161950.1 citrate lyase holo-[acyl-carrier protein] synthase [Clostridium estertheticum]